VSPDAFHDSIDQQLLNSATRLTPNFHQWNVVNCFDASVVFSAVSFLDLLHKILRICSETFWLIV